MFNLEENKKLINFLIFLVPILGILFIFREVIFQSKIFSHLDVLITFVPYYDFLSNRASLLSQNILSGFPVYVSTNSGWFNPINKLFFHFLDAVDTFKFLNVTYLILSYVFSYLFMRRIKIGHLSSILGATIFIFSGQVMLWSETIIITNYYFLMPLALYILDIALNTKLLKSFMLYLLLGVLFGWGFLSGHVQFLIYVYTLTSCYFLFFLWLRYKEAYKEESGSKSIRKLSLVHLCFFCITLLVSFIIGLPQIRAILDFLPLTARASGVTLDAATAYAYAPHHLIHYLLPSFKVPYISLSQSFQNYIGILPLMLFSFSFLVWKELKQNKHFLFFFGTFIFCFIASVKYSPIAFVLHNLPLYSSFRETFRVMFIGDFALAIVIAITIRHLWLSRELVYPRLEVFLEWFKKIFIYLVLPVVFIFSTIKIFFFYNIENFLKNYFLNNLYQNTVGGFPPEHYYKIINRHLHESIDQFYIFDSGIAIFLIFGLLSYLLVNNIKKLELDHFVFLAILVTVGNFSSLYAYRIIGIPKNELVTSPKTADFIKNQEKNTEKNREMDNGSFRIFSPLMSTAMFNESIKCSFKDLGNWDVSLEEFFLRRELIEPDLTILYDLESADGYEPYVPVRISEILGFMGSRFSTTDSHSLDGERISFDNKITKLIERKNIYRVLNVKYILTLFSVVDKDFKLVYEDEVGKCKSKIYIYELSNTFPRYFLTNRVYSLSPNESFLSQMDRLSSFSAPSIMIESSASLSAKDKKYVQSINPILKKGDTREFVLKVPRDSYFFIGEALLPGWEATVDGQRTPLLRANYIYSAIYLTPGKHKVRLEYKP